MSEAQAVEGKKRKRTGKQREEAKRAAIEAKLEAEGAAAAAAPEPAPPAPEVVHEEPTTAEEPKPAEEGGKKRKRTGKQREEAKRLAIQAKLAAEGGAAPVPEQPQVVETEAIAADSAPAGPDFAAIEKRIPPVLKKLHPVFKAAKKMESMRVIKKAKFLRGKGEEKKEEVAELEGQLKLLNSLQLRAVATAHLSQKLKKHHVLKRIEIPSSTAALLTAEPSIAASSSAATPEAIAKAENRLCSSKPVADAMKALVSFVMGEPGATLEVRAKAAKAPKGRAVRRGSDDGSDDESDEDVESEDEEGLPLGRIEGLESDDEVIVEDRAANDAGWESGSLGGGSDAEDDDDGWESGSVSGLDGRIAPPSDSGDESDASNVPPAKRTRAEPAPKGKAARADGKSSMFLPSLASGFAPAGDGDSDPDMDYDPNGIFGSKTAPRKNRRGQRARQAIWEKKYGKGANHVVKQREEEEKRKRGPQGQKRDSGWGGRGAAGAGPGAAGVAPAPAAPSAARPAVPAAPKPAAAKPDEKSLHPSWEAARLRKQREAQGAKATKIVFD
ncbi:putative ATP-dependent helicase IRC3 [Vanrija albida]|uniref:ATP-dependent helicase IRC3 n=1 Tax=Vanrija albida TaxID=181172 RepID=A0ABR3Q665_9TREE